MNGGKGGVILVVHGDKHLPHKVKFIDKIVIG